MAKKKTLEEQIAASLLEAEAGQKEPDRQGSSKPATWEDIDSSKGGEQAGNKESHASFPTASKGETKEPNQGSSKKASKEDIDTENAGKQAGDKESAASFPSANKGQKEPDKQGNSKEASFEEIGSQESGVDAGNKAKSAKKIKEDIEAILGEELALSDEFKAKAASLFETHVIARSNELVIQHKEKLQEEFDAELLEAQEEMADKVDSYMAYALKEWAATNHLEITKGLRTELAESMLSEMFKVFSDHNVTIPEGQDNLVETLSEQNTQLEEKYTTAVNASIERDKEIKELKRTIAFGQVTEGLAASEVDKLSQLVEGIEYESDKDYIAKVHTIRESYFGKSVHKPKVLAEDKNLVGQDVITEKDSKSNDKLLNSVSNVVGSMNMFRKAK